jgi:hypothetical protein
MYMLTGAILSLQNSLVLPPARRTAAGGGGGELAGVVALVPFGAGGGEEGGGDGAAVHVGSQSKQCDPAPRCSATSWKFKSKF